MTRFRQATVKSVGSDASHSSGWSYVDGSTTNSHNTRASTNPSSLSSGHRKSHSAGPPGLMYMPQGTSDGFEGFGSDDFSGYARGGAPSMGTSQYSPHSGHPLPWGGSQMAQSQQGQSQYGDFRTVPSRGGSSGGYQSGSSQSTGRTNSDIRAPPSASSRVSMHDRRRSEADAYAYANHQQPIDYRDFLQPPSSYAPSRGTSSSVSYAPAGPDVIYSQGLQFESGRGRKAWEHHDLRARKKRLFNAGETSAPRQLKPTHVKGISQMDARREYGANAALAVQDARPNGHVKKWLDETIPKGRTIELEPNISHGKDLNHSAAMYRTMDGRPLFHNENEDPQLAYVQGRARANMSGLDAVTVNEWHRRQDLKGIRAGDYQGTYGWHVDNKAKTRTPRPLGNSIGGSSGSGSSGGLMGLINTFLPMLTGKAQGSAAGSGGSGVLSAATALMPLISSFLGSGSPSSGSGRRSHRSSDRRSDRRSGSGSGHTGRGSYGHSRYPRTTGVSTIPGQRDWRGNHAFDHLRSRHRVHSR